MQERSVAVPLLCPRSTLTASGSLRQAGGLGMVTALTQPTPELLREEIKKARALLTTPTTPIGVNLTVIPAFKEIDHMAYAQQV